MPITALGELASAAGFGHSGIDSGGPNKLSAAFDVAHAACFKRLSSTAATTSTAATAAAVRRC
jgi:hypothetical protein